MDIEIKNMDDVCERVSKKGFSADVLNKMEQQLAEGKKEFAIPDKLGIDDDQVRYLLEFRVDEERQKLYLNRIGAELTLENGEIRQHSFAADKLITAREMYRMLKHGEEVAVNKTLFNKEGQQYNVWLSLDIRGSKDEYGNYPVNSYHQNYYEKRKGGPFIVSDALKSIKTPIAELDDPARFNNIEQMLKKARLIQVNAVINDNRQPALLAINPREGGVTLYDTNMKVIEEVKMDDLKTDLSQQQEVKKKPWEERRENLNREKRTSRGLSR